MECSNCKIEKESRSQGRKYWGLHKRSHITKGTDDMNIKMGWRGIMPTSINVWLSVKFVDVPASCGLFKPQQNVRPFQEEGQDFLVKNVRVSFSGQSLSRIKDTKGNLCPKSLTVWKTIAPLSKIRCILLKY